MTQTLVVTYVPHEQYITQPLALLTRSHVPSYA